MIVRALRRRISPKFKIQNLQPRISAKKCKCPSLFIAALRDNYITDKQVEHVLKYIVGVNHIHLLIFGILKLEVI